MTLVLNLIVELFPHPFHLLSFLRVIVSFLPGILSVDVSVPSDDSECTLTSSALTSSFAV